MFLSNPYHLKKKFAIQFRTENDGPNEDLTNNFFLTDIPVGIALSEYHYYILTNNQLAVISKLTEIVTWIYEVYK